MKALKQIILVSIIAVILLFSYSNVFAQYIDRIKVDGKYIRVKLLNNAALSKVVKMEVFDNFTPGYSLNKAISVYGNPDNIKKERGKTILEYRRAKSRIEIVHEETAIGNYMSIHSYPYEFSCFDFFHHSISQEIDPMKAESIVVIDGEKDKLLRLVTIKRKWIDEVSWSY